MFGIGLLDWSDVDYFLKQILQLGSSLAMIDK